MKTLIVVLMLVFSAPSYTPMTKWNGQCEQLSNAVFCMPVITRARILMVAV